jgi:hypothetical protein
MRSSRHAAATMDRESIAVINIIADIQKGDEQLFSLRTIVHYREPLLIADRWGDDSP